MKTSMTVEGQRPGKANSIFNVTVEPSVRIHPGLYLGSNNHYKADDFQGSLKGLLDELAVSWMDSLEYALEIAQIVLEEKQ